MEPSIPPDRPEAIPSAAPSPSEFDRLASERQPGLIAEYVDFLLHHTRWWLVPIVVAILLATMLVFLAGTVGPFIYPGL